MACTWCISVMRELRRSNFAELTLSSIGWVTTVSFLTDWRNDVCPSLKTTFMRSRTIAPRWGIENLISLNRNGLVKSRIRFDVRRNCFEFFLFSDTWWQRSVHVLVSTFHSSAYNFNEHHRALRRILKPYDHLGCGRGCQGVDEVTHVKKSIPSNHGEFWPRG